MGLPALTNRPGRAVQGAYFPNTFVSENVTLNRVDVNNQSQAWLPTTISNRSTTSSPGRTTIGNISWRNAGTYGRQVRVFNYESSKSVVTYTANNGHVIRDTTTGCSNGYNPSDWNPPWLGVEDGFSVDDSSSEAVIKALNRLNDAKVDLGQYLAESLKSAEMLADAAIYGLRTLRDVRRGKLPRFHPLGFGEGVNNASLQWMYGWRPLLSDIHQLMDNASNGLKRPLILKASASAHASYSGKYSPNGRTGTYQARHRNTCKLYAKISSEFLANANSYHLLNPVELAWNLVPFSFVVDWFMPIGDFLGALSARAGLDFVGGYSGQIRTGEFKVPLLYAGNCTMESFVFNRKAYYNWPMVMRDFRPYSVQSPFSPTKVGIITQLLAQLRK